MSNDAAAKKGSVQSIAMHSNLLSAKRFLRVEIVCKKVSYVEFGDAFKGPVAPSCVIARVL